MALLPRTLFRELLFRTLGELLVPALECEDTHGHILGFSDGFSMWPGLQQFPRQVGLTPSLGFLHHSERWVAFVHSLFVPHCA